MATTSSTSSSKRALLRTGARALLHAALGCLIVMGALELTLRAFDDFGYNGPDKIRRRTTADGVSINNGRPWYRHEFVTEDIRNDAGYRWHSFEVDPQKAHRVAVLGDSYVHALQVPMRQNLVGVADSLLADTQLLALGSPGSFINTQRNFYTGGGFDQMLGEQATYGGVDAIVVCTRMWGVMDLATGSDSSAADDESANWRHSLKQYFAGKLHGHLSRGLRSPSHALSYVSSRGLEWVAADMRNELLSPTPERLELAGDLLREDIVPSIVNKARTDGVAIGFLYLPSIGEIRSGTPDAAAEQMLRAMASSGTPWIDTRPAFGADSSLFFEYDHHPNARGHAIMGSELARLIRQLTAE